MKMDEEFPVFSSSLLLTFDEWPFSDPKPRPLSLPFVVPVIENLINIISFVSLGKKMVLI